MLIIDDANYRQFMPDGLPQGGEVRRSGVRPRAEHPVYGSTRYGSEFNLPLIPMQEWPDRIADLERRKASLWHLWKDSEIGVLDQNGLSYCHAFSCVLGIMLSRLIQGLPYVGLSSSSIGAPVTNYRNAGAWIIEDLEQAKSVGAASLEFVPSLTTRRGDFKPGWEQNAALHRVTEWTELGSRNFQQHGSAMLQCKPACNGLNYWGHAVTDVALVDLDKSRPATSEDRYGILFINSWSKGWGDGGCAVRSGRQKYADEAYIPGYVTQSLT